MKHHNEYDKDNEKIKPEIGTLFIVSMHIGNKDDVSMRASKTLSFVDFVVCEEHKIGAKFLREVNSSKPLIELNEHNEEVETFTVIEKLKAGKNVALISDQGTPLLADPGSLLVRYCIDNAITISAVPGPTSIMSALVVSGFSTNQFLYAGFVNREPSLRRKELEELLQEPRTVILLETPYRLVQVLEAAAKLAPSRRAFVGMNLTLPYETYHRGTFEELHKKFSEEKVKANFVLIFEGSITGEPVKRYDRKEFRSDVSRSRSTYPKRSFDRDKPFKKREYSSSKPFSKNSSRPDRSKSV